MLLSCLTEADNSNKFENRLKQKILLESRFREPKNQTRFSIYLSEVSLDAIEKGDVIALDKSGEWYIAENGRVLRHTKVMFKTKAQQSRFCQAYRYHDPTKAQDRCIYVLLCINYDLDRAVAISTIRKIDARCIRKYLHDWLVVPKTVLRKLIKHLEEKRLADLKTIQLLKNQVLPNAKAERDRYLMIDELWSKLRKKINRKRKR